MPKSIAKNINLQIHQIDSPVSYNTAREIESFYLKSFEYIDYDFKKILTGQFAPLNCTSFIAKHNDNILSVASCLYSTNNPSIAILGPVCTDYRYRKNGFSGKICSMLLEHIKKENVQAVYLGVKNNLPALNLYKKLGFMPHSGIVMRKLVVKKEEFNKRYSPDLQTIICKISWSDFTEVSALFCEPAEVYTFDFFKQIFSIRYLEAQAFLPVFPSIMSQLSKNVGFGYVLKTKEKSSIVGTAFIKIQPSETQNRIVFLDFFILDGFLNKTETFILESIRQSKLNKNHRIFCFCPECDFQKQHILTSLGAKTYSILPEFIKIANRYHDVIIYKLGA